MRNHKWDEYPEWRNPWIEKLENKHDPLTQAFIDKDERERNGGLLREEIWEKERPGWMCIDDPASAYGTRGYGNAAIERTWADHRYMEQDDEGKIVWTCYPYQLGDKDLKDFIYLQKLGFQVCITGCVEGLGYGHGTAKVIITPPDDKPAPPHKYMCDQYLYRHFDADGQLLYVGITCNPSKRLGQHRRSKDWFTDIAQTTYEKYASRADVIAAEKAAIEAEHPLWNVCHNKEAA